MDVYFRSSATSLRKSFTASAVITLRRDFRPSLLFAIRSFSHFRTSLFIRLFRAVPQMHALTLEVIDQDRRDAKPFRHGRLSTAPRRLLPYGFQAIFTSCLVFRIDNGHNNSWSISHWQRHPCSS